jgi:hypothetical protein
MPAGRPQARQCRVAGKRRQRQRQPAERQSDHATSRRAGHKRLVRQQLAVLAQRQQRRTLQRRRKRAVGRAGPEAVKPQLDDRRRGRGALC